MLFYVYSPVIDMSRVSRLLGTGANALPHSWAYPKEGFKEFMVIYKPASLPVYSDDFDCDSLAKRMGEGRRSLGFPIPLAQEEEGLQIVTLYKGMANYVEKLNRLGLVKLKYRALCEPPVCCIKNSKASSTCSAYNGIWGDGENIVIEALQNKERFHINNNVWKKLTSNSSVLTEKNQSVNKLFSNTNITNDITPAVDIQCNACCVEYRYIPEHDFNYPNFSLSGTFISNSEHSFTELQISTSGAVHSGFPYIRQVLSAHGLPVTRDPIFNNRYIKENLTAEIHNQELHRIRHNNNTYENITQMGTGLSRVAIRLPDPDCSENRTLLSDKVTDINLYRLITIEIPRSPHWGDWLSGGNFLSFNTDWVKNMVSVTWNRDEPQLPSRASVFDASDSDTQHVTNNTANTEKMSCVYCGGSHVVENCPKLNSDSSNEVARKQMMRLNSADGRVDYCTICSSKQHSMLSCSRRMQGVDPTSHCCICGSLYHSMWECKAAKKLDLCDRSKADDHAKSLGFSDYEALDSFSSSAQRERLRGTRPVIHDKQSKDSFYRTDGQYSNKYKRVNHERYEGAKEADYSPSPEQHNQ